MEALGPYKGYKSNVKAGITNEFGTSAYRALHFLLQEDVWFKSDYLQTPGK